MKFEDFRQLIRAGEVDRVEHALNAEPELLHVSDPTGEFWEERTALHCAARWANLDLVKLLVNRGAEVYSNPYSSYPAVFIAAGYAKDEPQAQQIVDYFLNEIPDKAEGTLGTGATIHIAARLGFADVVRKHLELDPLTVHQRGWLGDTPLHWSCHNGHEEIVRLLLDAGADIEADEINCYGGKPLHWASEHEAHIVQLLLARGAEVDSLNRRHQSDLFGVTPLLMNALQRDDCAEVTQLLLAAGADVMAVHQGRTALEIAREKGNTKIAAILEAATQNTATNRPHVQDTCLRTTLPKRPAAAHKGTFGSVLILAGSQGMSGAASLAGQAALHGGAGLVTLAIPRGIAHIVSSAHPSYMTVWLPDEEGRICTSALAEVEKASQGKTALAVGPGLGQGSSVQAVVHRLYNRSRQPMVLDADGLNAFVGTTDKLKLREHHAPRILTPHPGEFARLTGKTTKAIQQHREELSVEFARQHQVVLLLKGAQTLITDGRRCAVNTTGSTALATGGSGDILTGLIVALLAQGMPAFEAAQLAAHLHGLAGEIAGVKCSDRFVTSLDILKYLAHAWKKLDAEDVR